MKKWEENDLIVCKHGRLWECLDFGVNLPQSRWRKVSRLEERLVSAGLA